MAVKRALGKIATPKLHYLISIKATHFYKPHPESNYPCHSEEKMQTLKYLLCALAMV